MDKLFRTSFKYLRAAIFIACFYDYRPFIKTENFVNSAQRKFFFTPSNHVLEPF